MNIIYVYGRDWPSEKAGISFSTYTAYGMAECDLKNNVDLIFAKNTELDYQEVLRNYFLLEPLSNFKVHLIETETLFSETTKFYFKAFSKIKELLKQKKIDAIITRTVKFLPFLYMIKKLYNIKVFFEAHSFYLDPKLKDEYDRKKEYIYQKLTLPRIDGIICHQSVIKNLYQEYIPDQNYAVITYGFRETTQLNEIWKNNYIGYIGSLYDDKGVQDVLYALKQIEDHTLKLLIVGGRSHRVEKYCNLAKKLEIEDRVEITGWVDRSKVEDYLKKIKIGLVPVRDTFHGRYLTCPTKIFNYFSHGIPVIGSNLPTVREIVTDKCGLFYENGSIQELIEVINKLNSSPELLNHYSKNILDRAEELLFKKRGQKFIEFMKNC
ncbi:glycosyltransferase family 4 protein [Halocella sp. SP3-1]|uniref:glycosyltransferase family 4 protein n=1 Tax=Halocella sp. SP3-1 TaxID=2382161 RepID=UPI000F7572F4|nr:glycosyltransferase family 4 protein [Halocella sp. SP3-1]AZO93930.1 glycosyltransferase [Halocella sp. SP3-1]